MDAEAAPTPSARERDTTAIVEAAIELFAARGPAATTLREVAARAGVNYGLIHQYIGNKDDLLRLVTRRVSEATAAQFAAAATPDAALAGLIAGGSTASPYLRMLARTLLDGHDPGDLLGRSPALGELIRQIVAAAPDAPDEEEAAARVAATMSLVIGWRLFGPFLQHAVGLEAEPLDAVGRRVLAQAESILRPGA